MNKTTDAAQFLQVVKAERARLQAIIDALDKLIVAYEPEFASPRVVFVRSAYQWGVLDERFDEEEICS
jgi:hypothetical protein